MIFVLIFTCSCSSTSPEIDIESVNYYSIDNQSSFELYYNTGSGLDERTITIEPSGKAEIEEGRVYASTVPFYADTFFMTEPGQEKFLLRNDNGNEIRALQLSNSGSLNWQVETVGNNIYRHTLIVSSQMID